jgi:hypothetical protein
VLLEAGNGSGGADESVSEPVTPELALVDPELARRAREELRQTPEPRPALVEYEEPAPAPPVPEVPPSATAPEPGSKRARRKRRRRRALTLSVFLGAAATTAAVLLVDPFGDPLWESTAPPATPQSSTPVPSAQTTAARTTPPQAVQSGKKSTRPSQPSTKSQGRAAPQPGAGAQRTFAWVPVPKATNYLVQFYQGKREIFEAHPAAARILLPPHWTFKGRRYRLAPGRYTWSVRPGFGRPGRGRYGRPIVAAELVVPAASVG